MFRLQFRGQGLEPCLIQVQTMPFVRVPNRFEQTVAEGRADSTFRGMLQAKFVVRIKTQVDPTMFHRLNFGQRYVGNGRHDVFTVGHAEGAQVAIAFEVLRCEPHTHTHTDKQQRNFVSNYRLRKFRNKNGECARTSITMRYPSVPEKGAAQDTQVMGRGISS